MRKGSCKHFTGIQCEECEAGLNMREVTGGDRFGWAKRMPCFSRNKSEITCKSYAEPTDKELQDKEDEWGKVIEKLTIVMPLVNDLKAKNPNGGSGVDKCPVCGSKFRYAISPHNNHMHAKCDTEGCIKFME